MKRLFLLFSMMAAVAACKPTEKRDEVVVPTVTVEWVEGARNEQTGLYENEFIVRGVPEDAEDWVVWFWVQNQTKFKLLECDGLTMERFRASLYMLRPSGMPKVEGEYRVRYQTSAILWNVAKFPRNFSYQNGTDKPMRIAHKYTMQPLKADAEQVFAENASIENTEVAPEHIVPRLKHIDYAAAGTTDLTAWSRDNSEVLMLTDSHPEGWYRIVLDGTVKIEAADEAGAYYAATTLENIKQNGTTVRNMIIEDYPDFAYRGFMLNLASTRMPLDRLFRHIDLMAHYKLNALHLHLTDDYGWKIEIPAIPELTEIGGRRMIPQPDGKGWYKEVGAIMSTSTVDKDDMSDWANGHYTREEYIQIVKYAADRHIRVVPEIDFPGHSRAAVESLRAYALRTGDESYTPTHKDDDSVFESVQGVPDNTFDIALPSTYRFMALVFDEMIAMHREAGVPLTEIHIGGDEVPNGAWLGSPACKALLAKAPKGCDKYEVFYSYFANRVMDLAEERNIKICGWHEIVEHLDEPTWQRMSQHCGWINFWGFDRMLPIAQQAVAKGVNVVLSNCQTTYLEEMYSYNEQEWGNGWAGPIDIRTAFMLNPFDPKYPYSDKSRIIGIQSQLWTMGTNGEYADWLTFPKGIGNFDRAWNATPICSYDEYYSALMQNEIPYLIGQSVNFHIPQPGLRIVDGRLEANSPIPGAEIRYTFGEDTPTRDSSLWQEAVAVPEDVKSISARLFFDGRHSVTTTLRR